MRFKFLNDIRQTADQIRAQGSYIKKAAQTLEQWKKLLNEEIEKNVWLIKQCEQKDSQIKELMQKKETLKDEVKSQEFLLKQSAESSNANNKHEKQLKKEKEKINQRLQEVLLQNEELKKENIRLKQELAALRLKSTNITDNKQE